MLTIAHSDRLDPAFREHASGLIVPAELSREREVWTREEWRAIDKATKFLESKGVTVFLGCSDERCRKAPIERIRRLDGGLTLRCSHRDREVIPGI